jgi:UV DNA damage endonuclease
MTNNKEPLFKVGTVCMLSKDWGYKSTTAKAFHKDRDYEKLFSIWKYNIARTGEALRFLAERDSHFHFFRVSSSLFPLATLNDELYSIYLEKLQEWTPLFDSISEDVKKLSPHFRIVTHPGQFCVPNSKSANVTKNSLRELEYHALFMEKFKMPWSINIHLPGKDSDSSARMVSVVNTSFSPTLRKHLSLENDEKSSNLQKIVEVCSLTNLLVCYDVHHEAVNRTFQGLQYYLDLPSADTLDFIEKGWRSNLNLTPAFHLSNRLVENSVKGHACAHSDLLYEDGNSAVIPLFQRGWALEAECKEKHTGVVHFISELSKKNKIAA